MRHFIFILLLLFVAVVPAQAMKTQDLTVHTRIGPYTFHVEIAETEGEREKGLMFRQTLAADDGMLFLFGKPQPVVMWMKNTFIPLDMLFVRSDCVITAMRERAVPQSEDHISSEAPVSAVVELNGGTIARLHIRLGDTVASAGIGSAPGQGPGRCALPPAA